jgi:hypothetical protein
VQQEYKLTCILANALFTRESCIPELLDRFAALQLTPGAAVKARMLALLAACAASFAEGFPACCSEAVQSLAAISMLMQRSCCTVSHQRRDQSVLSLFSKKSCSTHSSIATQAC